VIVLCTAATWERKGKGQTKGWEAIIMIIILVVLIESR
jgi:hypothetical protein